MKFSEIERLLHIEFEYLTGLLPIQFKDRFKKSAFISGGCIYSMFNDKDVKDYDFFLRDKDLANDLYEYFRDLTSPFKNIRHGKYNDLNIMVSKYAISFGNTHQIVTKYVGDTESVVEQFDFRHNMFAWVDGKIISYVDIEYLADNRLHFNDGRTRDICGTLLRIPKFVDKGFIVSKKEMAKILNRLNENGFDDRENEILRDYTTY